MGKMSKEHALAYSVAGELFEKLRARGETAADAMRKAAAVLRAHQRVLLAPMVSKALPKWARELIDLIALDAGVRPGRLRENGHHSTGIQRIRAEAIYIVRTVGNGTPSFPDLGLYFGRDHSSLVVGDQQFRRRMQTDDILRARVERYLCERGFGKQEEAA